MSVFFAGQGLRRCRVCPSCVFEKAPSKALPCFVESAILVGMSTVKEIEAIRAWIDEYLEDQLELTDDVKAKLEQSRAEIAAGQYTSRQPK